MKFYKYHGTGNDFILIDDRAGDAKLSTKQVAFLCHRHFGIGADGLMLLQQAEGYDFRMVYYNSDGCESTMCGNGGRCLVAFAHKLGVIREKANFIAIDGPHHADILDNGHVSLHMKDVGSMRLENEYAILDTGSPHYVLWVDDVQHRDVYTEGKAIRYSANFKPEVLTSTLCSNTTTGYGCVHTSVG
jgi:diaminopimelate epimerase